MSSKTTKAATSKRLYKEFIRNMTPFAEAQGITVDTLIERLQFRGSYNRKDDPDMFPAFCVCGETLTAEVFQFDDPGPDSNYKSTYMIGAVCARNLQRELDRLKCVKRLGRYLLRPKKQLRKTLGEYKDLFWDMEKCKLSESYVLTRDNCRILKNILTLQGKLRWPHEKDTVYAEGVCVAYGMVPEGVLTTYFSSDGSLW